MTALPQLSDANTPRPLVRLALAFTLPLLLVVGLWLKAGGTPEARGWSANVLRMASNLPLQDSGRVKPLDSYAATTLLRMNHKRSAADEEGRRLEPVPWLLDVLLRPERARGFPCFAVENDEVLKAVGFEAEGKKKRDRYAFRDLAGVRTALGELARAFHRAKPEVKDRTIVENGVIELSGSLEHFDRLTRFLDFARPGLAVPSAVGLKALWPDRERVSPLEVLERVDDVRALVGAAPHGSAGPTAPAGSEAAAALALLDDVGRAFNAAGTLALFPPAASAKQVPEWLTPYDVLVGGATGEPSSPTHVELFKRLTAVAGAVEDPAALERELGALHARSVELAEGRGEYARVPLEVRLRLLDPFYGGVYLYLLGFLLVAFTWIAAKRWLVGLAWITLLSATALHGLGIVVRCVLRERPPVSTLYDSMLFIAWVGPVALLVLERMHRRGLGLALAPIFGAVVLSLANGLESMKREDTMPQLVAVLDTNFWLATHVTCITLGYSGGLLASLVAHVQVLGRAFGLRRNDAAFYALLTRVTYGMLGFALLFSVVGTILGGIWANDSWGRFWGWDPKENGALLICLAQLAILHARLGGLLKPYGVALATVAQGMIVAFSWWHVNLLGMGLHAYGFQAGIRNALYTFYFVEIGVLLTGVLTRALGRAYPGRSDPGIAA